MVDELELKCQGPEREGESIVAKLAGNNQANALKLRLNIVLSEDLTVSVYSMTGFA